ncbi:hypothetical protein [Flavobacterium sp. MMS24-S5]|uniref:hypothetical protein n=1 Tax=Flavobacterium sp. MMS24-S5 TaxID=3416605 RepID=UPI003CFC6F2D
MRSIKIYCRECEVELTSELNEVLESTLRWEDYDQSIIAKSKFSFLKNIESNKNDIVVAIDDYNLINHADKNRFYGCCGSDGTNGLNKLCINGHEVATEFSDCWTGHYIEFDDDKIFISEKNH